ncbi:hypothetical protein EJ110_NYTH49613 [Nymphaea thermarum]|nr:hypothetical protein EJ110_NYTH49613 [Nymphaea thermarum]
MKDESASDQAAEEEAMEGGRLRCVVVAVDGSEESMHALRWGLDNLRLRPAKDQEGSEPGQFVVLHVQSPPNIAAGLNPGAIPFGGPGDPKDMICEVTSNLQADVLVMGSRAYGAIKRYNLLSSHLLQL